MFVDGVTTQFYRGMGGSPYYRTHDQCNSKWANVNKLIMDWNKIYTNFEKQWVSGEIMWKKFGTYEDISNHPKRSKTSSYSSSQHMSSDSHIGVDLNDDNNDIEEIHPSPRPMGKDKVKAKGKVKATSSNSSVETGRSTNLKK
ncbi:unnamed protein product [Lactuca virosa]|uniref:Myb/SANT-like domain-containing protein n=1 Tax=Lactuca virosa TaxID=75947 RepID=A0AAU9PT75_9ASTR|nr:unnamed protein product [Lactuca virosa]